MERSRANKKSSFKLKSPFPSLGTGSGQLSDTVDENETKDTNTTEGTLNPPPNESKYKSGGDIKEGYDYEDGKKWHEKKAFKDSGIGHIVDAVKVIRKGIKDRKAKKAAKREDEKARGRDAVAAIDKECKEDYGYLPWEEGYTPENEVQYNEDGQPIKRS